MFWSFGEETGGCTIRAPFPGAIKTRDVHPGECVKVQSPVMVLVRTDQLRARLAVPERWAGWVRDGAMVDLHAVHGTRLPARDSSPRMARVART
ncbi:MAG TPA: HlyD family secretion protein [Candidatus Acidoferrum sp.]|jgi:multidrug resistance efflux pump